MARPTKLTEKFLKTAEEILKEKDGINTLVCTDHELISLINEKLPEAERITDRTFRNWEKRDESPDFIRLKDIVCKARIVQKISLVEKLKQSKPGEWQRFAWLLERKFSDFSKRDFSHGLSLEESPDGRSVKEIEEAYAERLSQKVQKEISEIDEFFKD